jgi:IPT/TIG domain
MKTSTCVRSAVLLVAIAATLGCGYSSKNAAPAPGTMPTIAQLNPSSMAAGSAAFTMTVTGTNFLNTAVVNWNGSAQSANTKFVSATEVQLDVPATAVASAGMVQVSVTNPGTTGGGPYGGGGTQAATSNSMTFTIN